jgi:hypothetical protein
LDDLKYGIKSALDGDHHAIQTGSPHDGIHVLEGSLMYVPDILTGLSLNGAQEAFKLDLSHQSNEISCEEDILASGVFTMSEPYSWQNAVKPIKFHDESNSKDVPEFFILDGTGMDTEHLRSKTEALRSQSFKAQDRDHGFLDNNHHPSVQQDFSPHQNFTPQHGYRLRSANNIRRVYSSYDAQSLSAAPRYNLRSAHIQRHASPPHNDSVNVRQYSVETGNVPYALGTTSQGSFDLKSSKADWKPFLKRTRALTQKFTRMETICQAQKS